MISGSNIKEYSVNYSDNPNCGLNQDCVTTLNIESRMERPVYFYIKLNHFYQNHQRYIDSKDEDQLRGIDKSKENLSKCYPIITNADAGVTHSYEGDPLVPSDPAIPCGLIAHTLFTGSFSCGTV